jgi:zinc protease
MDEVNGKTGVAHVLEHMMFKGTRDMPPGEFSRQIARAGGRDNAFTSRDHTAYFQQLHKSQLALSFKLEADRMANLILSEEEFAKEIKVVMEERRLRTDDQAQSRLFEQIMAAAYQAHPYRAPIIGWMNDLEAMTVEDAREWYRRWYTPNNATLIVVGDVKAEEVFALAEQHFGSIQARELPTRKPQREPVQIGMRRLTAKVPAELPRVVMAYHVPSLRDVKQDWEPYALAILSGILDGHDAARLDRQLVREGKIAVSAGASYDGVNRGEALFFLDATPVAGQAAESLEAALKAEIRKIVDEGVSEQELKRVKAQVVAGQVFQLDSMFNQARLMGVMDIAGLPYDSSRDQGDRLLAVTGDQVREVTKKYFIDDNLTVAILDPQPLNEQKTAPAPAGLRH